MSALDQVEELKKKYEKVREEFNQTAKKLFSDCVTELFAEHPSLESFSWTQYTPYFNDGDECTFSVCCDYPDINGEEGRDLSSFKWEAEHDKRTVTQEELAEGLRTDSVVAFLRAIPEGVLKDMFDDHVRVTVTRNGVETDGYEHD